VTQVTDRRPPGLGIIPAVTFVRQAAAALLLLGFLGTPAAACLVAVSHMTPDEEQCCREMAGDCGKVIMPVAHSCCPAVQRDNSMTLALKATKVAPVLVVVALPQLTAPAPERPLRAAVDTSPPESPPGADSILRI